MTQPLIRHMRNRYEIDSGSTPATVELQPGCEIYIECNQPNVRSVSLEMAEPQFSFGKPRVQCHLWVKEPGRARQRKTWKLYLLQTHVLSLPNRAVFLLSLATNCLSSVQIVLGEKSNFEQALDDLAT